MFTYCSVVFLIAMGMISQSSSGSFGAGGTGSANSIVDFGGQLSSPNVLQLLPTCSSTHHCQALVHTSPSQSIVYSYASLANVTLPANATGVALVYIDTGGNLIVAGSFTGTAGAVVHLACDGHCNVGNGTQFPSGAIPLFTWSASTGAWDPTGFTDLRMAIANAEIAN